MPALSEPVNLKERSPEALREPGNGAPIKRHGPVFAMMQAALYLALCVAALEVLFYVACVGDGEHVYPDLHVGYKIFAGKRVTQRNEGFGCFKMNSFGMQNDEISVAKPPGTYRVAVFGDSYVESLQVARQANYLNLFGKQLSEKLHRPVEVLNFGVSNYSVAQDYLRYQQLAKQFKPDMVIQVYRCEEIAKLLPMETQSLLFVRPVFFPGANNTLVYDNTCVRQFITGKEGKRLLATNWLRANSRIWGIVSHMWQEALTFNTNLTKIGQATLNIKAAKGPHFELPTDQVRSNYAKCYWYMMDAQLTAFKNECTAAGSKFIILRTPMVRPGMHTLINSDTETALLMDTANKQHIPVLNIDKAYRDHKGETRNCHDDGTDFSSGGHFTPPMHLWVATQVSNFLQQYIQQDIKNQDIKKVRE